MKKPGSFINFSPMSVCVNCKEAIKEKNEFCNWACQTVWLMRIESMAFVKDELKYPEYLIQMENWRDYYQGKRTDKPTPVYPHPSWRIRLT